MTDAQACERSRPAYLGLGANIGRRARALADALAALAATQGLTLATVSSVYETEPVGVTDQPRFLNLVARFDCRLSAAELLAAARKVERQLGRVRARRWGPRVIDVDILLLGHERIDTRELTVPHPEMTRRQFVLAPLAEIAPQVALPGGRTAGELSGGESPAVRRLGTLAEVLARESANAGSDG
jgi:2-amino-4-hydroxy-6-hydroxymethyldihydropteridine diphosphokinase